ncbi:MAG: type II toxin-antitoxin system PemK/MazF family toxin [Acidimicrobiia bacterium]
MNRGEVWWVEHPEEGRRPALVLTRAEAIPLLRKVLVVPATRTRRGIPSEVPLDEDDGMPGPCALSLDNIRVVPKAMLTTRVTRLPIERMIEVCAALRRATGC